MPRIHIGLTVEDLESSIGFYSTLFGSNPSLQRPDYAKWMLEEPRVNFSITTRCAPEGKVHFGIQVEEEQQREEISDRLAAAGERIAQQPQATCCYHHSSKTWARDPQGFHWETFLTSGVAEEFGTGSIGSFTEPSPDAAGAGQGSDTRCCGTAGS